MSLLGLDIGGANIKASTPSGQTLSRPFAIWKEPHQLASQVRSICSRFPDVDQLAITMTAELADCFTTKAEGVRSILDQVNAAMPHRPNLVWTTAGQFLPTDAVSLAAAAGFESQAAAANWHALATWIGQGRLGPSTDCALLVDIGTTTTDIIPSIDGRPASLGLTDVTRLQSGELCYSGVRRTPVCAIAHSVPFRDGYCAMAAELFATTLDVYLLLGDIAEDEQDFETANGKPATRSAAHDRMARMVCGDRHEVTLEDAVQMARFIGDVQRQRLAGALERVLQRLPKPCQSVIVSGSGSFLARRLIADHRRLAAATVRSLDELLSPGIAEAACAYAVANLAASGY
jgi:probable H4MPT-linked C1 transfer pathway protein